MLVGINLRSTKSNLTFASGVREIISMVRQFIIFKYVYSCFFLKKLFRLRVY